MRHDEPATMMHLIRPLLLLLAIGALLLIAEAASGDSVRVHDVSGSDGPAILLSHVAELDGAYADGFAAVEVGRFVEGESTIEIKTSAILESMREAGAKLGRLDFSGFTKVVVHRTFGSPADRVTAARPEEPAANIDARVRGEAITVYTPTTVRALIEREIAERMGFDRSSLAIAFNEKDETLLSRSAVAGRYEVEPIAEPTLGAVSFRVSAYRGTQRVDDGQIVSARVQRRVIAVIAAHKIARGETIRRQHLRLREVLIDDTAQAYIGDTALVTSQVANKTINPGDLVTAGLVRLPVAVGRRERVAVELNTGGIRITFNGIAQSEGSVGQTIDVQNAKTGERFTATVVARGKVVAGPRITEAKED